MSECACKKWKLWEVACGLAATGDDGLCDICRARRCILYITHDGDALHQVDPPAPAPALGEAQGGPQ